jgi:SAM-dependent methyltransferase
MTLTIRHQFGDIDIYLFDQLLKGRIARGMRVLDAGCGYGRNLVYLLREGIEVFGVDPDPQAVDTVRELAKTLAPTLPSENFRVEHIEKMTLPDRSMDVVICSAVLHFARDPAHFDAMVRRMWQALVPGGLLFCRLATSTGIESQVIPRGSGRYLLPDGSERYLVTAAQLIELTASLNGSLLEPVKSTIVQDMRCMATWVARAAG